MLALVSAVVFVSLGQNVIPEEELSRIREPLEAWTNRVDTLLIRYWSDYEPSEHGKQLPSGNSEFVMARYDRELVISKDCQRRKTVAFSPNGGANARLLVDRLAVFTPLKSIRLDYQANAGDIREGEARFSSGNNMSPLWAIGWFQRSEEPLFRLLQPQAVTEFEPKTTIGKRKAIRIRVGPPLPEEVRPLHMGRDPWVDLWLDPARDFRPLRTELRYRGEDHDDKPIELFFTNACDDFRPVKDEKDGTTLESPVQDDLRGRGRDHDIYDL